MLKVPDPQVPTTSDLVIYSESTVSPGKDLVAIYGLYDPRDMSLRYIGKTCDPGRRLVHHWLGAIEGRSKSYAQRWLTELDRSGGYAFMRVLVWVPEHDWAAWERYYIAIACAVGWPITNTHPGGNGYYPSKKPRQRKPSRPLKFRRGTPEHIEHLRANGRKSRGRLRGKMFAECECGKQQHITYVRRIHVRRMGHQIAAVWTQVPPSHPCQA